MLNKDNTLNTVLRKWKSCPYAAYAAKQINGIAHKHGLFLLGQLVLQLYTLKRSIVLNNLKKLLFLI